VSAGRVASAQNQISRAIQSLSNPIYFEGVMRQADVRDQSDVAVGITPNQIAGIALWPGADPPGVMKEAVAKLFGRPNITRQYI
jgi:hypothetical protein